MPLLAAICSIALISAADIPSPSQVVSGTAPREINQTGVTIILVEQNARMALRLAKTAYVIEVGEISLHGDAKTIENDPNVIKAYLGG